MNPVKVVAVGPVAPTGPKYLEVRGMFGIGDCIFQRAILRPLMLENPKVRLLSYYKDMFWDLEEQGLAIDLVNDHGRIRDSGNRSASPKKVAPRLLRTTELRLTYDRRSILHHGSILAAMYASAGYKMPVKPDFSLPVKSVWTNAWRKYLADRGIRPTKPILVYRPIILNTKWTAPARAPDPVAYDLIYRSIRDKFFVIGIADLNEAKGHREWVVGSKPDVDLELYRGELDFGMMCGLFKDAKMVFGNPGFVPVLAQALGTPNVIVYGGNESFKTTNSVGAHLAPTCPIDIDNPCACHMQTHDCDKRITIPPAIDKVLRFTETVLRGEAKVSNVAITPQPAITTKPRVLIFGTMYADTDERAELTKLWYQLHSQLNPDCALLLVDSASPKVVDLGADTLMSEDNDGTMTAFENKGQRAILVYQFKDNIGHLSRNGAKGPKFGGRDGWGRAFCRGLDYATGRRNPTPALPNGGYDYVVHIEGDSLFKHPVLPIIERMRREGQKAVTVPVKGTKNLEKGWVETGLMFFDTQYLRDKRFTERYDWANRKVSPTPERVIYDMLEQDQVLTMQSWAALRGDKNQINLSNIQNLDWVTHVRDARGLDDVALYRKYCDSALQKPEDKPEPVVPSKLSVKINLGCGTNKLEGWDNHDADVDINRKLPFRDNYADFIFAEHVVEHTNYYKAIDFFKQCYRVLKPGGVLRITTPSIERIHKFADEEYFEFVHSKKWAPTKDRRGALHAILYCHGHQTAWTAALLESTLYYCGFDQITSCKSGESPHPALVGIEGHAKVIGEKFNWIESISVEGTKGA